MPPIGIHFLVNFAIAAAATSLLGSKLPKTVLGAVSFGLVFGSVFPDTDLVVSSLSFAVTFSTEAGKIIHRTLTHSVFLIILIILIGLAGALLIRKYKLANNNYVITKGGGREYDLAFSFKNKNYLFPKK